MTTRHTMTDAERAAAWDRVADEMRAGKNDTSTNIQLAIIAAVGLVALALLGLY